MRFARQVRGLYKSIGLRCAVINELQGEYLAGRSNGQGSLQGLISSAFTGIVKRSEALV